MLGKAILLTYLIGISSLKLNSHYDLIPDELELDLTMGTYDGEEVYPKIVLHESEVKRSREYIYGEGTPKFFIRSPIARGDYQPELEKHPSRVEKEEDATFIVVGPHFDCRSVDALAKLPKLPKGKAYLTWTISHKAGLCYGKIAGREDMLVFSHDLRSHDLNKNDGPPMRGVTMSPAFFYNGETGNPSIPAKYFLTYRGQVRNGWQGSSSVRPDLKHAFASFKGREDVVVEFLPNDAAHRYSQADRERFQDLTNTSFFLNPHGDNRYMNGFATSLGSCAVPVIMSDGLTMPFEELIDWRKAAVFVPEKVAKEGAEAVIKALPSDPTKIQAMRAEACRVHEEYFSTIERRIDALLKSAAIRMTMP